MAMHDQIKQQIPLKNRKLFFFKASNYGKIIRKVAEKLTSKQGLNSLQATCVLRQWRQARRRR
jgi:hypothetical protein